MRNLKGTGPEVSAKVMDQVVSATQFISTPFSQLRPGPSPRRKRALPKPTSYSAEMEVVTALGTVFLTARTDLLTVREGLGAATAFLTTLAAGFLTAFTTGRAGFFAGVRGLEGVV